MAPRCAEEKVGVGSPGPRGGCSGLELLVPLKPPKALGCTMLMCDDCLVRACLDFGRKEL